MTGGTVGMFNVNATNLVVFNVDTATSGTVGMFNVNATNRGVEQWEV